MKFQGLTVRKIFVNKDEVDEMRNAVADQSVEIVGRDDVDPGKYFIQTDAPPADA